MMTSLFSIFDPTTSYLNLNWLMMLIPMPFLFDRTMKSSKTTLIKKSIVNFMYMEITPIMKNMKCPTFLTLISIFLTVMMLNIMSLAPFNFSATAQVSLNFELAMTIWLSFLINGWANNMIHMAAHLLPEGTPAFLMPLLVLIETSSQLIRPITLAVRLTANMVAGHLLLALLSELSVKTPLMSVMMSPASMILSLLEICVSFIQAYVFVALITLYASEIK